MILPLYLLVYIIYLLFSLLLCIKHTALNLVDIRTSDRDPKLNGKESDDLLHSTTILLSLAHGD